MHNNRANHLRKPYTQILLLLIAALIRAQSITASLLPFPGIRSLYETDSAHTDISAYNLTLPGEAQVWRFDMLLKKSDPDTLTFSDTVPDTLAGKSNLMSIRNRTDNPEPIWTFHQITESAFLQVAQTNPQDKNRGIRYDPPATIHPLPLAVGMKWQSAFRAIDANGNTHTRTETVHADAAGSLILTNGSFFTVRLRIAQITHSDNGASSQKQLVRWIAPYVGTILEIESSEAKPSFSEAVRIRRMVATNAGDFGCDPSCDPQSLQINGYALKNNFPNPFNASTLIPYTLPFPSQVIWSIHNILGQTVFQRHETTQSGTHHFIWHAVDNQSQPLPNGLYLYRMEAHPLNGQPPFTETKRMILSQ